MFETIRELSESETLAPENEKLARVQFEFQI